MNFDFEKARTEAMARKNVLAARLQEIPQEKARLDDEIKQIQVELVALDQILEGVSYMEAGAVPEDFEELGFRAQIERILQQHAPGYLLPTQIREKLEAAGTTGSTPRNLLISIHTILGRLDKDSLIEAKEQNGRAAYRWKGTVPMRPFGFIAEGIIATRAETLGERMIRLAGKDQPMAPRTRFTLSPEQKAKRILEAQEKKK